MEQVTRTSGAGRRPAGVRVLLAVALGLLMPSSSPALDESLEYQVKAAFVLNFTKFVDWPANAFSAPDSPISICILGEDPFGEFLPQLVAGEVVEGRRVSVQRIRRAPGPKSCQLLFVGRSEKEVSKLLAGLGPGVLTVGDEENFIREGGMIAFLLENRRVRFEIHASVAQNAGLKISSKLMSVAKVVEN